MGLSRRVLDPMHSFHHRFGSGSDRPLPEPGGWPASRNENAVGEGHLVGRPPGAARRPPHKMPLSPLRSRSRGADPNAFLQGVGQIFNNRFGGGSDCPLPEPDTGPYPGTRTRWEKGLLWGSSRAKPGCCPTRGLSLLRPRSRGAPPNTSLSKGRPKNKVKIRANRQPLSANRQLPRDGPKDKVKIHWGRAQGNGSSTMSEQRENAPADIMLWTWDKRPLALFKGERGRKRGTVYCGSTKPSHSIYLSLSPQVALAAREAGSRGGGASASGTCISRQGNCRR